MLSHVFMIVRKTNECKLDLTHQQTLLVFFSLYPTLFFLCLSLTLSLSISFVFVGKKNYVCLIMNKNLYSTSV